MIEEIAKKYKGKIPEPLIKEVIEESKDRKLTKVQIEKVFEKLQEKYDYSKIQSGEAIGIITAESIGEPGTQMSLDYEEKVIVRSGNQVRIVKIGEFIDKIMDSMNIKKIKDETEIFDLNEMELFVPAISPSEKIDWRKVTQLSRHTAPKNLLKLVTRSGRSITATPFHSFVIRKNNQILPVAGSSLKKGDRIPCVKNLKNEIQNNYLNLQEYLSSQEYIYESELKKAINNEDASLPITSYEQINNYKQGKNVYQLQQNCVYSFQNHSQSSIPELLPLDEDFGFLVGAYLAEGTHSKYRIGISNNAPEYRMRISQFADKYNIHSQTRYEMGEYGESITLELNSKVLADLLNKTCSKCARNKFVPNFAFTANKRFIRGLLQAYFDGDGNISVDRKTIRASSSSKELRDGIAILLSEMGIFTTKSTAKNQQYTLNIPHKYASLFAERIDCVIPRKKERLQELISIPFAEKRYDVLDMIPGISNIISDIGKKLDIPSRYTNKFTKKQKIGRETLQSYIYLFEEEAKKKKIDIKCELQVLKTAVNSEVVWDEIVSIEEIVPTKQKVYDFSVEDLETFTTFDGLITHNTLRTFHFAGVAEVNVTLGLPRLIEIFDARKEPSTPLMTVFLNKPYNKDEKFLEKIIAQIKEIRVSEILSEVSINLLKLQVEFVFNKKRLKELGLNEEETTKYIKDTFKNLDFAESDSRYYLIPKNKDSGLPALYNIKEKLKEVKIKGINGIQEVIPKMDNNEIVLLASGSNLKDVFKIPEVDYTRTLSNDLFEIYKNLGIEAAKQIIIQEASKVLREQSLDVDIRHIMLISDLMTNTGEIKGITRSGITEGKESVLARASFETPIKHLINASLKGEVDKLNSVVENVMINQPIPLGTSLPNLVTKDKEKKK